MKKKTYIACGKINLQNSRQFGVKKKIKHAKILKFLGKKILVQKTKKLQRRKNKKMKMTTKLEKIQKTIDEKTGKKLKKKTEIPREKNLKCHNQQINSGKTNKFHVEKIERQEKWHVQHF